MSITLPDVPLARQTASFMSTRAKTAHVVLMTAAGGYLCASVLDTSLATAGETGTGRVHGAIVDAMHTADLLLARTDDPTGDTARLAIDGVEESAWMGRPGESQWRWSARFLRPVHVGLLRARFGQSPTSGVPTDFHWEIKKPMPGASGPDACRDGSVGAQGWVLPDGLEGPLPSNPFLAQPTRRSWFMDADLCALRLVVDRTNAGPPVLREVQAIEGASDVLRDGVASDDGAYPDFRAADAIDGTYERRWVGAPGRARWTLRVDLRQAQSIDRIHMVVGFDATTVPRVPSGRGYAMAWGPVHYSLETSDDGRRFVPVATEPVRGDGSILPLRRRLVTVEPRIVRAIRLVISGATSATGLPDPAGVPVVRELSAYRSDDRRPVLLSPWILSVNANPSSQPHAEAASSVSAPTSGESRNDTYHAKFLQTRFAQLLPALRYDDRFARQLGAHDEWLDAPPGEAAGEVLESIEGDDPQFDAQFLAQSSPPPIAVLSGSNDWDYASTTHPDPSRPKRWHWDPLRDARFGGMGQLGPAVRNRVAPFLGFCGGAQILALLEAQRPSAAPEDDGRLIDLVLRRTTGRPIRGFAPLVDVARAWPTDPHPPRVKIQFTASDPLFSDIAGRPGRSTTQALPESHADAIRDDAFLARGPLQRMQVLATSSFCAPDVIAASPRDGVFPNPGGAGMCDTVPEAFRSRDAGYPVIGTQFHAEQKYFSAPATGDPPESVADPLLFLAAAYELMVDAYIRLAP
jgi:hypothetical protein